MTRRFWLDWILKKGREQSETETARRANKTLHSCILHLPRRALLSPGRGPAEGGQETTFTVWAPHQHPRVCRHEHPGCRCNLRPKQGPWNLCHLSP